MKIYCDKQKNFKLDSPHEIASYNSRIVVEEKPWHIDSYIAEMEGEYATKKPLTMEECAGIAEECLMGRNKAGLLCMGNINEKETKKVESIINARFLDRSLPLGEYEIPVFASKKLPTNSEASLIFGTDTSLSTIPTIYEEVAFNEHEENNAIQILLQTEHDHVLGFEGLAILDLIGYMAHDSAFSQLRTKEQLGYIASAHIRRSAGGSRGLAIVVQSSSTLPQELENRCEAWLATYRTELHEMSEERLAMEAGAVVAQLLEKDNSLSEEVGSYWGEISSSDSFFGKTSVPNFDRVKLIAEELILAENEEDKNKVASRKSAKELKKKILEFFDKNFLKSSPHRRAISSRVYSYNARTEMEKNIGKPGYISTEADARRLKQYLSSFPVAPFWCQKF